MINLIKEWFENTFSNRQAAILSLVLVALATLIYLFGSLLAPVFAAVVIAYLLNDLIGKIKNIIGLSRFGTLVVVFILFIVLMLFVLVIIVPDVIQQLGAFVSKAPAYLELVQKEIDQQILSQPTLLNPEIINNISQNLNEIITKFTQKLFTQILTILPNIFTFFIYLVLVPMLTWFLLKDKTQMLMMVNNLMPKDYSLTIKVWRDVDSQLQNYIRGKLVEIAIVSIVTYILFLIFDLQFALLLAVLVGFSVLIPYVGAVVSTVPVILVAYAQFGISNNFTYILLIFVILQALDAYVLVPMLFAKAMDMHPIIILVSILFFGGLWGFWGLFFAIPLVVLLKAVLLVWPRPDLH